MGKATMSAAAIAAMLTLCALAASPAFAGYFASEAETVEINGTNTTEMVFQTKFGEVECSKATLSGTGTGTAVETGVFAFTTLTVHPAYTECTALGFNATVNTTGCNYQYTEPTTTSGTGHHLVVDLVCSGTNKIHIVSAGGLCSVDVPAQSSVGLLDLMDEGIGPSRDIDVDSTVNNVNYTGVGGLCSGAGTGGTLAGKTTLKAFVGAVLKALWAI